MKNKKTDKYSAGSTGSLPSDDYRETFNRVMSVQMAQTLKGDIARINLPIFWGLAAEAAINELMGNQVIAGRGRKVGAYHTVLGTLHVEVDDDEDSQQCMSFNCEEQHWTKADELPAHTKVGDLRSTGVTRDEFHIMVARVHPPHNRIEMLDLTLRFWPKWAEQMGFDWKRADFPEYVWDWEEDVRALGILFYPDFKQTADFRRTVPPALGKKIGRLRDRIVKSMRAHTGKGSVIIAVP